MHTFFNVIRRELRRIAASPFLISAIFGLPFFALITPLLIFVQEVPRHIPVAVCDLDHSNLSRDVVRKLDADSFLRVEGVFPDIETGKRLLLSRRIYQLIVIPNDFERDVQQGTTSRIADYFNNQWFTIAGLVNRELAGVIETEQARVKSQFYMRSGNSPVQTLALEAPVRVDAHTLFNPFLNYCSFLAFPLTPTLLQLAITMLTIFSVGIEIKNGTTEEWLESANRNLIIALLGKLLPYTAVFFIFAAAYNFWLVRNLGLERPVNVTFMMTATLLLLLACEAIGLAFITITGNLRKGLSATAIYCGPAFAFGGLTFPAISMPWPAKLWSSILPLPYFLKIFVDQAVRGASWQDSLPGLGALAVFIIIGLLIVIVRLPQVLNNHELWGKP